MPLRYKSRLLRHLAHENYTPQMLRQLAEDLGVEADAFAEFAEAVKQLAAEGQLVLGADQMVTLPPMGKEIVGVFRKNPKGFGFVIPRDKNLHGDLFIPPDATSDALSGDIVRVEVQRTRGGSGGGGGPAGRSPFTGEIVEVLERKRSEFSGELVKRGGQWLAMPDGRMLRDPVVIRDPGAKNAKEGDKIVFELVRHPEGSMLGEGAITRVLGASGEPDVETAAVIATYGLPGEFPEECIEQAREATQQYEREIKSAITDAKGFGPLRTDVTGDYIITIDPPDAKDFDDAISIEKKENGGWLLGIFIADVAHFIAPGSPLDLEAAERGNSCYLPRLVIPMLPEVLSNGICSLQEGVPRYCKAAYIDLDREGNYQRARFASVCIRSAKRLTYLEAQGLIDGNAEEAKRHAKTEPKYDDRLIETLREMDSCSKAIQARRMKRGMIRLDLPEVELIFDDGGKVVEAVPEDDAFTHTLIEMFMVEANEAVARLFEWLNVPLLRRVHAEPIPGDVDELRKYATVAGFKIPKNPDRRELQALLESTRGTPAAKAIHFAVLRSLSKAEYSPARIGHFALASDAYAHFTSPIRRYPDLTVHRALRAYLEKTDNGREPPRDDHAAKRLGRDLTGTPLAPDEDVLVQIGQRCVQTEVNAEGAERDLRQFLVLQLLQEKHIGDVFQGVVTGVMGSGVFVQIEKYLAEGMIKAEDLPVGRPGDLSKSGGAAGGTGDASSPVRSGKKPHQPGTFRPMGPGRWRIDPKSGALVEQNTGRSFNIGDTVDVAIAAVDLPARKLDLLVADPDSRDKGKAKKVMKLTLGADGGGLGAGLGSGFKEFHTGADKRASRSKSREKHKKDFRSDRKNRGH